MDTQTPSIRSAMYPRNLFVYSSYWGKWSRVLRFMNHGNRGQVEVNLTTPNCHYPPEWEKNSKIWIREHGTSRGAKDIYAADLPGHALDLMRMYLPEEIIDRLLHDDLLPQIDFEKHQRVTNGGAPLHLITKD